MQTKTTERNLLDALLEEIANRVAAKLVDRTGPARARPLTLDDLVERKIVPSRRVGREHVKAGRLVGSAVGRELFFDPADVEAFLAARKVKPSPSSSVSSGGNELDEALGRAGLRLVGGGK